MGDKEKIEADSRVQGQRKMLGDQEFRFREAENG
jgi:hypothetical protein